MATTQNYSYPSSSDVTITGIGNPTGQTVPADAVYIAGKDPSGNLHGVAVDSAGDLIVSPLTSSSTVTVVQPTGTNLHAVIDSGTVVVTQATGTNLHAVIDSSALPTGASTSALQTTGNTSVASIDSKTPALGQALAAASVPVVLTAAQLSAIVPLTTVSVTQSSGANLHTVVDSGSIAITSSPLPTGAATSLNQSTEIGFLTTIASNSGTQATAANQTTGNTSLASVVTNQTNGTQKSQAATPTALTLVNASVSVGTTAVRLVASGTTPSATRVVLVASPPTASVATYYIGSSSVTSTTGIPIVAGQTFIANNDAGDYYVVASVTGQTINVMEQK